MWRAAALVVGLLCLAPAIAGAETLRIATWHVDLSGKGPGLLLRDIREDRNPDLPNILEEVARIDADILLLSDIDYDLELEALTALRDRMAEAGIAYPHLFARRPNAGMPTGLDLDGDGRLGGPRDAQGFGYFNGQGGMALLSRLPLDAANVTDLSAILWRDVPDSLIASDDPGGDVQRLSSSAHWDVPVMLADGRTLHLLAFHATPPVFDGPEDRNGRRNADELRLWQHYLDGALPQQPPAARFMLLGNANLDAARGDGRHETMQAFLRDPRFQDPAAGTDTADWPAPGPGPMRVSYTLPSADIAVLSSGEGNAVGAHRPIWIDVEIAP